MEHLYIYKKVTTEIFSFLKSLKYGIINLTIMNGGEKE